MCVPRNVLAFVILMAVWVGAKAQVRGKYCCTTNYAEQCYTFNANGSFFYSYINRYDSRNCAYGGGNYRFVNDSLHLHYTDAVPQLYAPFSVVSKTALNNPREKVKIWLQTTDAFTKEELPFVTVQVLDEHGKIVASTVCNFDGQAVLLLVPSDDSLTLKTNMIGFGTALFKFIPKHHFTLHAQLSQGMRIAASGTQQRFSTSGKSLASIAIKGPNDRLPLTYTKR